jgi:hypothetical protein
MSTLRTRLRALLNALERGDTAAALAQLEAEESQAFLAGSVLAGEFGYARWRLAGGDTKGAIETLRRLVDVERA